MNRKLRFRQKRHYKFKIVFLVFIFLAVLFFGMLAVELNRNYMFYGEPRIEMLQIKPVEQDTYELSVFNNQYTLNLKYLKREMYRLKAIFEK